MPLSLTIWRMRMISDDKSHLFSDPNPTLENLEVLRTVLLRLRNDDQGGFNCYRAGVQELGGHWMFVSTALPQTTPDELDALMDLAGIIPDEIVPIGHCYKCKFSNEHGNERGYKEPCLTCKHPLMSNFQEKDE
jgi:hypothetical protein